MHITSEYPAPLSPRVNLRIQRGGNNRPEWVATFASESVATIIPEWVATFARNPQRWLALESGLEWIPRPLGPINQGSYSINANDELYLVPFGARYVFEPKGTRMRLSAGGGGAYLNHTIGQQALWATAGLSGWGGQFVVSGDYRVTNSGKFRMGFTARYFYGTVRYTYPDFSILTPSHILTIGPEFTFCFR